jgi:hypothetical protein
MSSDKTLHLAFHGRVIDHLGIEMYQSPVAAIAELISNAWDADATDVQIELPSSLSSGAVIRLRDNGSGMTFDEIQTKYLNVGYNRRKDDPGTLTPKRSRPLMGRKGIGKFAGFGIAAVVEIETTSEENGETTTFSLNLEALRGKGDEYVGRDPIEVDVVSYFGPDEDRRKDHGSVVTLRNLTIKRNISLSQFGRSMARRFLLLQRADDFTVTVNGSGLPAAEDLEKIEFSFPTDYRAGEGPAGLTVKEGWGIEQLPGGGEIRWRIIFYKDTIDDEELTGISVFAHKKLAQRPFLFNLSGGLGGQAGTAYISGQVEADFIDERSTDMIATERQRINWELEDTQPLLEWGQQRVRQLLRLWRDRRAEAKVDAIKKRLEPFAQRVARRPQHERQVIERALHSIAKITTLSSSQFAELATSMLTAWEGGRLQDLIYTMSRADELDEAQLLQILAESRVLSALSAAERVRNQLELVRGLGRRIQDRELENAVRDYIAENPWLIAHEWETFHKEIGVRHLVDEALQESGMTTDVDWNARVDLVLSSSRTLLVVEFMRPGLKINFDHLQRFERYVLILREKVIANASQFDTVHGLLVADHLDRGAGVAGKLQTLRANGMEALDWPGLLARAEAQWVDYFDLLLERAPEDDRLKELAKAPVPPPPT